MECYDTEEGGDDDDDNFYIGEKRSGGELLGLMFRLGKKVVITGVVISSVPLLVPPMVVISAVGCALSLPFGVVFASYACTDKLMSKLLLPPEYDEDQQQSVVAPAFEYEQLEEETEEEQGESVVKDGLVVGVNDAGLLRSSSLDNDARVDELRMNDVDESNQHTTISEVDDYCLMGMDVYGDYTTNIPLQLEREDIYHVAALELIDAIDKFSTGKEEEEALETRTESVDEIDKFSTGKEDDYEGEEDEKVVETRTESVDEIDEFKTDKEDDPTEEEDDENVVGTQTEIAGEIDKFSTGKEDDHKKEEDENVVVTGENVDHMDDEDENVVGARTELVDEIDMFSTRKEDDHKEEEEDEKVVETPTESDDEIYKFLSGQKVDHTDEEDGKVEGSRTESIDEIDKLELGKEDGHKEEENEKVLETQTDTVDEIDKFSTGKEDDQKEKENENIVETPTELVDESGKENENIVETPTELVDESGKFQTGKEVDRVEEEDEKVVEAQTELTDEIDKFSSGKEGEKSVETTGKEEEKSVETQTESADEIDKLPTGEEDDHKKEEEEEEEEEDEKPVETPPLVFPLPKDTDDKMYSSSGKKSTTSKQVIIERRRGGKRKFKASSSALKLTPSKRKGLSQGTAGELEEEITILKEADQSTTSAADKNLVPAGEDAVVHKSGSLSSGHAYKAQEAGEQSTMLESSDDDDDTKQIILLIENRDDAYPVEMHNDNNNAPGVQLAVASSLKNSALSDVLDENVGAGTGNETKQQQTVIPTAYNDHPQREENYKQPKTIVSDDSELKNNKAISLIEEKDDTIISLDVGVGHSDEVGLHDRDGVDDENIWKTMEAIRGIIGYKAPANDSRIEELKALFLFTGIEPPTLSDYSAHEFHNNIRFLMSVIGLK